MNMLQLPVFFDMQYTDTKGNLTPNAKLFNDQTYQVLNIIINYFNNGLALPQATGTQITAYGNDTTVALGTLWFNSTTGKLNYKSAASTIQVITSS